MLKRFAQVSLVVFMVFAVASMVAAQTVAVDTVGANKKGSLLVFPLVQQNSELTPALTTYFFIGNDGANRDPQNIKCYWMDGNQSVKDFVFDLTHNGSIVFTTEDAPNAFKDPAKGALLCYAVDLDEATPVPWNHLYGYAALTDGTNYTFYNAYGFRVNGGGPDMWNNFNDGSGRLVLGGDKSYDKCQKYLVTTFIPYDPLAAAPFVHAPDLTLWPCVQQVNQDRVPTYTKAKFDVWNYREEKLTGAWQCFKCWFEGYLHVIGNKTDTDFYGGWVYDQNKSIYGGKGVNGDNFLAANLLDAQVARLRIQGVKSSQCSGSVATGLLGVMLYGEPAGVPPYVSPMAAHTLHGAGQTIDNGYIYVDWDGGSVPEAPGQ